MARYKPGKCFDVPMYLYTVTSSEFVRGVTKRTYSTEGILFFGSFATYGGTEREANGVVVVEDTASVETFYRPEFAANCRISLADEPAVVYEIQGTPENIERRNHISKFKVRRVAGGA